MKNNMPGFLHLVKVSKAFHKITFKFILSSLLMFSYKTKFIGWVSTILKDFQVIYS